MQLEKRLDEKMECPHCGEMLDKTYEDWFEALGLEPENFPYITVCANCNKPYEIEPMTKYAGAYGEALIDGYVENIDDFEGLWINTISREEWHSGYKEQYEEQCTW